MEINQAAQGAGLREKQNRPGARHKAQAQ